MPLKITLKTFGMSGEQNQLKEILNQIDSTMPGETLLFPEFGAYTEEGSRKAYHVLTQRAFEKKLQSLRLLIILDWICPVPS